MFLEDTCSTAPAGMARIAGALYLGFIVTSVAADALGHIGLGSAGQLAVAISTAPGAFRLGLVVAFVSALLLLLAAWGLYVLLRPVNPELALLFLLLNAVGVAIQCASMLGLVWALLAGEGGAGPAALPPAQREALVQLALELYRTGFVAAQLFFGAWLFPLGYLVIRSRVLPRLLGALLILDGVAELVWFLQALLLPAYPAIRLPGTAVSLVAEVGLALWLVIRGTRVVAAGARPDPAAGARAGSAEVSAGGRAR